MQRKKNFFDKIASLVPGYVGYAELEQRRQCDKILRDHIATELVKCERMIQFRIAEELKKKSYEISQQMEDERKRINILSCRIRYSPYGVSAFFSNNQIREPELQEIFHKDFLLAQVVKQLKESLNDLDVSQLLSNISSIDHMVDERNEFIKEYK